MRGILPAVGPQPLIAVVGGEERSRVAIATLLRNAGFDRVVSSGVVSLPEHGVTPDLLVAVGYDIGVLCVEAQQIPAVSDVPILAVVPAMPASAAQAAIADGASEVIVDPPSAAVLGARVRGLLRARTAERRMRDLEALHDAMVGIQELIARGGDGLDVLRDVLLVAVGTLGFDRASLIATVEGSEHAYVIAATDDPSLSRFTVRADKYPEVLEAIHTGEPVLIDDATQDPITSKFAPLIAQAGVRGIAIIPVVWKGRPLGVVSFRKARSGIAHLSRELLDFSRVFATQLAAQLKHGAVLESLRDQTHRLSRASYEAERRLRTIESLKEHFEAAADGVVALDDHGRIIFVNRAAEEITGFARDGLLGSPLVELVPPAQRAPLEEVIYTVLNGDNLEAFDLDLSTTSGQPICVSVTTSTVLSRSGAVILSFRDVTAERVLEIELRKTKDFLERLIDSTVDAIIAADTRGQIILFNQGAERIFGYTAADVVGKMPVWQLYPDGVARHVMKMLRSTSYGGVGRLEQTRRELVTKDGGLVPVNMTASIIYEDGREVASVGIFSDLRERIRIEQRLLQAQAKLQVTEKQAVLAELAGATAHELNQPLTSILGYAQLIVRQSDPDASHLRAVGVILREGERMAGIVKKIGRITKYETKEYVGGASILDLDKSSASSSPSLLLPSDLDDTDDDGEPTNVGPARTSGVASVAGLADSSELLDDDLALQDETREVSREDVTDSATGDSQRGAPPSSATR